MRVLPAICLPVLLLPAPAIANPPPWPVLTPCGDETPRLLQTTPLFREGDLPSEIVESAHFVLDRHLQSAARQRNAHWRKHGSDESFRQERRRQLAAMLGLTQDDRSPPDGFEYHDVLAEPRATAPGFRVHPVRWPAFARVHGTGLLLEPKTTPVANVIAVPDAGQLAEELAALPPWEQLPPQTPPAALQLAAAGCRVLIPRLVPRERHPEYRLSRREWIHRPAFELGRTLTGYELQILLAAADRLESQSRPLGILGWGEGGRLALFAGALDDRFEAVGCSGYFGPREDLWQEPASHNLFGFLRDFGDAELAALIAPRRLIVEHAPFPKTPVPPKSFGKPGAFATPTLEAARAEMTRARALARPTGDALELIPARYAFCPETLTEFLAALAPAAEIDPTRDVDLYETFIAASDRNWGREQAHQFFTALERHNQEALIDSPARRTEFFNELDAENPASFRKTVEPYRNHFRTRIIGELDEARVSPNPRSRPYLEGPKTISHEVWLQVYPDLPAYGILTLPKDLDPENPDRRPVVVCQHGLEGRPQQLLSEARFKAYQAFATRLAERGYVTFAPQNLYLGHDRFRLLQFKANSIGTTLFSLMIPQHRQITDWLASLPFVDPGRIAFYGLSYGGKSAMRIPPLVNRYALSICSADFNDWIWKCAATDSQSLRYSYVNKREYEMFEFNLGNTFNYSEMAALIAPRPFMVERGHFDGVGPDYRVAGEYAKVRRLYSALLGIPEKTDIEWFVGGHTINGQGTFRFLDQHLDWNPRRGPSNSGRRSGDAGSPSPSEQ